MCLNRLPHQSTLNVSFLKWKQVFLVSDLVIQRFVCIMGAVHHQSTFYKSGNQVLFIDTLSIHTRYIRIILDSIDHYTPEGKKSDVLVLANILQHKIFILIMFVMILRLCTYQTGNKSIKSPQKTIKGISQLKYINQ